MARDGLSKSRILAGLQCEKRLWLDVHRRELAQYSDGAHARFRVGHRVGEVAREQKAGRLIGHDDALQEALAETVGGRGEVHDLGEGLSPHRRRGAGLGDGR